MKKLFAAVIAAAFLLMSVCMLTACGNAAAGSGNTSAAAGSETGTAAEAQSAAGGQGAAASVAGTDAGTGTAAQQESGQTAAGSTAEAAANGTAAAGTNAAGNGTTAAANAENAENTENTENAGNTQTAAGQDAPVADTSTPLTTEQAAEYAQTSYNDLASAIMLGMQDSWQSVTTDSLGISDVYAASPDSAFGFSIQDINSDGIPEMLIGETVDNDASSPIYDIFSADITGTLIHVFTGGAQNRCFLYENGTLANQSDENGFFHYVLENNMLVADDSGTSGGNYVDIAFTYFIAQ